MAQLLVAVAALIPITACFSAPVATPPNHVEQETPLRIAGNKVDVLFMVDNSSSMKPMQDELRGRFGDFLQIFAMLAQDGFYTDLHIGVVTSDYGAGGSDDGGGGCTRTPGGDLGRLQAVSKEVGASCKGPTDKPFIRYAYGEAGRDEHNLPAGQSLGETFTCIASVGVSGCGFEHQLESVWAALKNSTDNRDFLRPDALLAVVFVTNEDDGSAPPTSHLYERAAGDFGPYDTFRQSRFGIACGDPPSVLPYAATPKLEGCVPANSISPLVEVGAEYPIDRYVQLFKNASPQGGVKTSPADVLLFAIDGPEAPVQVVMTKTGSALSKYELCKEGESGCVARIQHSCVNRAQSDFFADPSVRLNSVLRAVDPGSVTASICGDDLDKTPSYTQALTRLADEIRKRLPGCIPVPLADGGTCVVTQDVPDGKGGFTSSSLARCDGGSFPCWKVQASDRCVGVGDGQSLSVERNGVSAPAGATLRAACSTKVL